LNVVGQTSFLVPKMKVRALSGFALALSMLEPSMGLWGIPSTTKSSQSKQPTLTIKELVRIRGGVATTISASPSMGNPKTSNRRMRFSGEVHVDYRTVATSVEEMVRLGWEQEDAERALKTTG